MAGPLRDQSESMHPPRCSDSLQELLCVFVSLSGVIYSVFSLSLSDVRISRDWFVQRSIVTSPGKWLDLLLLFIKVSFSFDWITFVSYIVSSKGWSLGERNKWKCCK